MSRPRRPGRKLVIVLAADEWDRLEADALRDLRDPWQQARYILLAWLARTPTPDPDARTSAHADVA